MPETLSFNQIDLLSESRRLCPPKNFEIKQKPYFSFCMFILFQFTQMLPIKINRISCTAIPLRPDVVVEIAALLKKVSCYF